MATRGQNTFDLAILSNPKLIKSLKCIDGLRDHKMLLFDLSVAVPVHQPSTKYIWDYRMANFTKINEELQQFLVNLGDPLP